MGIGEQKSAREILDFALRYKSYWGEDGGITVSGGEPLLQIDFLLEFFKMAKAEGIHTTIDTAGWPFTRKEPFFSKFKELMQLTDLVMLDIKHIDDVKHRELTKQSNATILDCAQRSKSSLILFPLSTMLEKWKYCPTILSGCTNGKSWG